MEKIVDFFINLQTLKEKKRRGWIVHQIGNSESTASHIFRMSILGWILGKKKNMNIEELLKMALIHDVCEVFAFDETPYDPLLPKNINNPKAQNEALKILEKWPKFTLPQKKEKVLKKREREWRACQKLFFYLPPDLKKELEHLWKVFEEGLTKEGRFLKQVDKAENFLQGMEYWEKYGRIQRDLWIRWAREIFDDPILIKFEKAVEERFYEKKSTDEEMQKILEFLIKLGKLKQIEREGWILRKVPQPETVADHCFSTAIMGWILSAKRKDLDKEKVIKISLIHKFPKVYAPEFTPYDSLLPNPRWEIREMIENPSKFSQEIRDRVLARVKKVYKIWPKFSKKTKEKIFEREYKIEKKALEKLISLLPPDLGEEIFSLWEEFKKGLSKEGRFVYQVKKIEELLQALQYAKRDKSFPLDPWWVEIREKIDDPYLINLIEVLSKMNISKAKN